MSSGASEDLLEAFRQTGFHWPFRRYQALALDAYESRGPDHRHRCYLVMPPGSGKTALGLEIIRRAGNRAVVFCPNTAVQQQWAREWQNFEPHTVHATTDPAEDAPLASPRYIIPRFVSEPPESVTESFALGVRYLTRGRTGSTVVYHAVPEPLARNRERVSAFDRAWQRHVSSREALFHRTAEADAILQMQAGADPFAITTQMRTLWR